MLDDLTPVQKNQALLEVACKEIGLQPDVKLVEIKGFRWVLDYDQDDKYPIFWLGMLKLEAALQNKTGRPIDLRLEAMEDKNKRKQRNVLWDKKK